MGVDASVCSYSVALSCDIHGFWLSCFRLCVLQVAGPRVPHTPAAHLLISSSVGTAAFSALAARSWRRAFLVPAFLSLNRSTFLSLSLPQLPSLFHLGLKPHSNHRRFSLNLCCCLVPRAPAAPSARARA